MSRTLIFALVTTLAALAAQPPTGLWDASVTVNGVEIPFRFEISAASPTKATGAFFNGDERLPSTTGRFSKNALLLEFPLYAARLDATFENGELTGTYKRGSIAPYPFHAKRYQAAAEPSGKVPDISGLWDIQANSSKGETAWRLIVRQSGASVSAAVLRVDGDTGELNGAYRDGKFILSHFSGARPSVLRSLGCRMTRSKSSKTIRPNMWPCAPQLPAPRACPSPPIRPAGPASRIPQSLCIFQPTTCRATLSLKLTHVFAARLCWSTLLVAGAPIAMMKHRFWLSSTASTRVRAWKL